jgi:hypothetical protein
MKLCPKCQKQYSDDANFCPVDAARLVPLESQAAAADPIAAKFHLGGRLGGSRTGTVYRATDKATGLAAAVKIIAPSVVALPGLAQRLERELKQLERVHSAGVAKVLASGKRGDDSWVALELLDGAQTLAETIAARGPISLDHASQLIEVIGEALIEAAQVGVVHRDLAPKNILLAGNDIKLINFSLPVPISEKVPGVPEFVAPEQHDGKPVDQRSNLYSLGALYYFVLTGQPVQVDDTGAVRPPSLLAPVPGPVEAVILRALDKSPTKRFLTVRQFIDEVGRVMRSAPDGRATQAMGRVGKPRAELVQTLLGVRAVDAVRSAAVASAAPSAPVPSTVVGFAGPSPGGAGAAPAVASTLGATVGSGPATWPAHMGPEMLAPLSSPAPSDHSPWAPPSAPSSPPSSGLGPSGHAPVTPVAPVVAAPVAATVPAAPVISSPLPAAPILGESSGKKSGKPRDDSRGKFRETMWFKKGELDAQAAQAAAEERAKTGKDVSNDKADSLPLDERYKDDGSLSRSDKEKYSLRTGGTSMMPRLRESGSHAGASNKVSEDSLIDEMKGGRNKIFAFIAIGLVAIVLIILLLVR